MTRVVTNHTQLILSSNLGDGWEIFNGSKGTLLLGQFDVVFLIVYAFGVYFSRHFGDNYNFRIFLNYCDVINWCFYLPFWFRILGKHPYFLLLFSCLNDCWIATIHLMAINSCCFGLTSLKREKKEYCRLQGHKHNQKT